MRGVGSAWDRRGMNVGSNERKGGVRLHCFQDSCLSRSSFFPWQVTPHIAIGDPTFGMASSYSGKGIPLTLF